MEIIWLDTVDSTNLLANRMLASADDMTVWAARFQTSGRGQKGNKWLGEAGCNLTFSILIKPVNLLASSQFYISEIASLSVAEYLEYHGVRADIKWPNDVYAGDRKICGMLIENKIMSANVSASIVGIGINLNQRVFSPELRNPTSLVLESGAGCPDFQLEREMELFMDFFRRNYEVLAGGLSCGSVSERDSVLAGIHSRYSSRLYRKGVLSAFCDRRGEDMLVPNNALSGSESAGNRVFMAEIVGVNPANGCLRLRCQSSGDICEFSFKEVAYII